MSEDKYIYKLKLHETFTIEGGALVKRVPGGWIYIFDSRRSVFVPFNNEFAKEKTHE